MTAGATRADGEQVIDRNRVVAFGVADVDDVRHDHKLTFPNVAHLPLLKVEWF